MRIARNGARAPGLALRRLSSSLLNSIAVHMPFEKAAQRFVIDHDTKILLGEAAQLCAPLGRARGSIEADCLLDDATLVSGFDFSVSADFLTGHTRFLPKLKLRSG